MRYIVTGHGRTGTHFATDILTTCLRGWWEMTENQEGLLTSQVDHVILHTNETILAFEGLYQWLYDKVHVIYCYRRGGLAVFTSLAVAQRTNQWNYYGKTQPESFEMDVNEFLESLDNYYICHRYFIQELRRVYPPNQLTVLCYEDIINSGDHRRYVCDKIGLEYFPITEFCGPQNDHESTRGRSPWNYREIITNYNELEQAFNEHFQRNPPPWINGE